MILIEKTTNPDGTTIKHDKPFNPSGKAIYVNGLFIHEIKNTFKTVEIRNAKKKAS